MDLIYKIYSVMLYDNQLNHDYILLYNKSKGPYGESWDLPYDFTGSSSFGALNKIYNLDKSDPNFLESSINIISKTAKRSDTPFIKTKGFLTIVKTRDSHIKNYNGYDIYWNETKSGINLHEFEVAAIWNEGGSTYSSYRIWEYKDERDKLIRDYKLNKILNK